MYHQPTEQHEYYDTCPEDPLVLLRPPFHHPDSVPAYSKRISNIV